ncbi:TonB-dependent receptor [Compostibacter hankyongensis]|uniref:TonB-dependent receptor n=1 Tax=Compostibacter hankyongensis TaxID=1007089 RepID=A0ABP8FEH8_9BACT
MKTIFTLLLLFPSFLLFAQDESTGTVRGTIAGSDGLPAANITVSITRSSWGSISNEQGKYIIRNIKPGSWTLKISAVGMATQEKKIHVAAGQTLTVDFRLKENAAALREVVVSGRNPDKVNTGVAKMPLKNLENPQVYNTVTSAILKQQAVTDYDDAMRNVPGISRTWASTGRAGDGGAYFALRGFDAQPALVNGLPGLTSGDMDPADVEEIEVLKGPSGTLFGGSFYSYGGIINTITKKPYYHFGGEAGYQFGSFGLNRVTADINTPLSSREKIAMRINTAYHSEGSFQDAGFRKSFFLAPSLVYEVNDRLSFHILTEILQEERAVPPVFFHSDRLSALPFKTIDALNLDPKLSFTSNDLTIRNPKFNLQARMEYKLSGRWTSQTVFSRGTVKSDGIYTYIWDDDSTEADHFSQYFHDEQQTTYTTDIQQNFNGDFNIGRLRNRLLLGLDFFNQHVVDNGSGWGWARNVTPQGDVNYVDPFSGDTLVPVYLTKASIDNLLAGTEPAHSNISNSSYAAYVSDVINITPGLMLMASLRADYFDSKGERSTDEDDFSQFALSPKFGLVYQPVPDKVSLFANYMNAFINVAPAEVADPDGSNPRIKSFKPEHANQWEAGVKANLFSQKLSATLSYYDIRVSNRVVPVAGNPNDQVQGGKVGSRGLELDLAAYPLEGLSLIAGYSYNHTAVIEGNDMDFYSEPGRSPGGQGPQHTANFWGTYTFHKDGLRGLGLGIGGNYAGRYKVIDNSQTGVFYLPAYTLLNASLFYEGSRFRAALNVNNLSNTEYYIGYWSVNPQKPRNFVASLSFKF